MNSKTMLKTMLSERNQYKQPNIQFHLYEMSGIGKSIEIESSGQIVLEEWVDLGWKLKDPGFFLG